MVAHPNFRPRHANATRHVLSAAAVVAAALTAIACGATSTTSVGPTPVRCELSLSATPNPVASTGGPVQVAVTAAPECAWTATESSTWITSMTPASGQGNGQITLQTAANNTLNARQDNVSVNGINQVIRQDAGTCAHQLSSLSTTVTPAAQNATVSVTVITGCPWTAASNTPFVTVASGASGNGNGTVTLNIAANTAAPSRQGTVTIAGQTFTVTQGGAACTYSVAPTSQSFGFQGGSGSSTVTSPDGCAWTATSSSAFITVTSGGSGSGTGGVSFSVSANPTLDARQGSLTIAGQTFTVSQGALECSYSLNPSSASAAAGGGSGTTDVTTSPVCGWSISDDVPGDWLTFSGSASRLGSGTVTFNAGANPAGVARSSSLTIAGHTFSVTQEAADCQYSISPTSQSIAAGGGTGTVTVTATQGCGWTAETETGFITVTSGASGTGNGQVGFSVPSNPTGNGRQGSILIAGQRFTVNQAGTACNFSINPASANIAAAGGTASSTVTAPAGCGWNASVTSGNSFITITSGASGNGNGTTNFTVAAQAPGSPARTGTLSIAGQTFTVNQAPSCTFSIAPTSLSFGAGGGNGSSTVTTLAGCAWTAQVTPGPSTSFITITSGATGNGNGTTAFTVAANTGPARTGTITIAGQTFTVNQDNGCTFNISPTSLNVPAAGGTGSAAVTAGTGCTWSAMPNHSFISISSGANGSGNGTTNFTVQPNTGAARMGTLLIAGRIFTVNQASGLVCTYTITPTSRSHPNAAVTQTATVTVTAATGCMWTAVANTGFLGITAGASGNGNGTVTYSVGPNLIGTRTGTLTIAGQTFTVTQGP